MNRRLLTGLLSTALLTAVGGTRLQGDEPGDASSIYVQVELPAGLIKEKPADAIEKAEKRIIARVRQAFPCAFVQTRSDVVTSLHYLRQQSLLGVPFAPGDPGEQKRMAYLGSTIGATNLIYVTVTPLGSRWIINGRWLDTHKAKALAMNMQECAPSPEGLASACEKVADKLADDAAYFEICPYTGSIKLTVRTTRSKKERVEYPVFCNESQQQYVRTSSEDVATNMVLELTRMGRPRAVGTIQYDSSELKEMEENDPCHPCDPRRKAPRIYTEHGRTTVKVTGISEDSRDVDKRFIDVRVNLLFNPDGTYRLDFVAASKPGSRRVRLERKAEGSCDTKIEKPKEDYTVQTEVPVGKIVGPFQGSPKDKVLANHEEFRSKDPGTGEETTINVEFNLRRD